MTITVTNPADPNVHHKTRRLDPQRTRCGQDCTDWPDVVDEPDDDAAAGTSACAASHCRRCAKGD